MSQADREQPAPEVTRGDIAGWILKDRQRLDRLRMLQSAGAEVLPEEITMVEATIAQLEAEIAYLDAVDRREAAKEARGPDA